MKHLIKRKIKYWTEYYLGNYQKYGVMFFFSEPYRNYLRARARNEKIKQKYGSYVGNKKALKIALIQSFGNKCQSCFKFLPFHELTIDHILKRSNGGSNKINNLQLLCRPCHKLKDSKVILLKSDNFNKPFENLNKLFLKK